MPVRIVLVLALMAAFLIANAASLAAVSQPSRDIEILPGKKHIRLSWTLDPAYCSHCPAQWIKAGQVEVAPVSDFFVLPEHTVTNQGDPEPLTVTKGESSKQLTGSLSRSVSPSAACAAARGSRCV